MKYLLITVLGLMISDQVCAKSLSVKLKAIQCKTFVAVNNEVKSWPGELITGACKYFPDNTVSCAWFAQKEGLIGTSRYNVDLILSNTEAVMATSINHAEVLVLYKNDTFSLMSRQLSLVKNQVFVWTKACSGRFYNK
jgi:hypothetical protein